MVERVEGLVAEAAGWVEVEAVTEAVEMVVRLGNLVALGVVTVAKVAGVVKVAAVVGWAVAAAAGCMGCTQKLGMMPFHRKTRRKLNTPDNSSLSCIWHSCRRLHLSRR